MSFPRIGFCRWQKRWESTPQNAGRIKSGMTFLIYKKSPRPPTTIMLFWDERISAFGRQDSRGSTHILR